MSEIRSRLLSTLIIISFSATIAVVIADQYVSSPVPNVTILLCIFMILICIGTWLLVRWNSSWATGVFLAGLMITSGLAFVQHPTDAYLYPLVMVVFSSVWLLSDRQLIILTMGLGGFVVLQQSIPPWKPALVMLTTLLITLKLRALVLEQIDIFSAYYPEAARKLEEARVSRGHLVHLTRQLDEAFERLRYANLQLHDAYRVAEEARQLKAQFAANVSHELRTPINLIVGFGEMMVMSPESYGKPLPAAYRADMLSIYRNAQHLQSLINDILDISQIETESLALTKEETDLATTLNEAIDIAKDLIERSGLKLVVTYLDVLPKVWIDRTRIRQVTINLLTNAVRFTDQGVITIGADQMGDEIQVSVTDTGIGLDDKDKDRIFQEFFQADGSLSRKWGGTGLGLALSKRFINEHGGRIWVESGGPGLGCTFHFTLPLQNSTALRYARTRAVSRAAERTALVQDEDPAIAQLFERYMSNYRVVASRDLKRSIEVADFARPTVAIIGEEQYDQRLEEAVWAHSPSTTLIICPMPSGRRAMRSLGMSDYLVKPVTRQALTASISELAIPIRKVLVIDDNQDIARMFKRMFDSIDPAITVFEAYGGEDGLAIAHQVKPDLVLLDILMPDMDGFDVIQLMKQDRELQDVPIVVISAYGAQDLITPRVTGTIQIKRGAGFTAMELVKCADAVGGIFNRVMAAEM